MITQTKLTFKLSQIFCDIMYHHLISAYILYRHIWQNSREKWKTMQSIFPIFSVKQVNPISMRSGSKYLQNGNGFPLTAIPTYKVYIFCW